MGNSDHGTTCTRVEGDDGELNVRAAAESNRHVFLSQVQNLDMESVTSSIATPCVPTVLPVVGPMAWKIVLVSRPHSAPVPHLQTSTCEYRGTSLIRNAPPSGPYSRTIPRVLWWSQRGGGTASYERGTPVVPHPRRTFPVGSPGSATEIRSNQNTPFRIRV